LRLRDEESLSQSVKTGAELACAQQFRHMQQDEFVRISLEKVTSGAEGEIIIIADDDMITVHCRHILDRKEGEGKTVTRRIGRAITTNSRTRIGVPDGHQVNVADFAHKAIRIGLCHIHKINPLEARRQREAGLLN
jgi:hypothetical protein